MAQVVVSQVRYKHTGNPMKIQRGYATGYLRGSANIVGNKSVYLRGKADSVSSHTAYLYGTIRASKAAYLHGSINLTSNKPAFMQTNAKVSASKSVYAEGWLASADADSERPAYLKGTGQPLLPIADVYVDQWKNEANGGVLYPSLADASDSTYVWFDNAEVGDYFEVQLDVPTPLEAGNSYIRWRAFRKDGTQSISIKCALRQGNSEIASSTQTISGTTLEFSYQLTPAEVASITDYTNLRIRVTVMGFS